MNGWIPGISLDFTEIKLILLPDFLKIFKIINN